MAILLPVTGSDDFRLAADNIREKAVIFDRLRSILRLDSEDGRVPTAEETDPDAAVLALMENSLSG
jgi:hypothetical protein